MSTTSVRIQTSLEAGAMFDVIVQELSDSLAEAGLRFEPGPAGAVHDDQFIVARVVAWEPGERITLEWHSASWAPDEISQMELRLEARPTGTQVVVEHRGWERMIGDPGELTAWFARQLLAPWFRVVAPRALGDWITDRRARRPSGAAARAAYRDPLYHYPNFRVILNELALSPEDELLEVGCGGGALLRLALQSGCRAAAVDHSPDMVRLARETNRDAVAAGRLDVREASADALPFPDATFSCAVMTGVLGFLPDPVAALRELGRVLRPGGRIVVLGADPELRGTPAAPEPIASRLRFYDEGALADLGRAAGFADVQVVRREMLAYAREAGVPEEHLSFFAGPGARFLLARKG
jgi:SAM-dependent methyltransferase